MTDRYEKIRKARKALEDLRERCAREAERRRTTMTDRYENIRYALGLLDSEDYCERAIGYSKLRNACRHDTIRALLAERDVLARENEAMRRCAIKYLGWLGVTHKPLDAALREDMANPDMCGDAALNLTAAQENDDA